MYNMEKALINMFKNNNTNYLSEIHGCKAMYAGVTGDTISDRIQEHIITQEFKCDVTWQFMEVSSIDVKYNEDEGDNRDVFGIPDKYKKLISTVENHLINEAFRLFGNKCKNSTKNDGTVMQTGGRGINDINNGDVFFVYIFYKM